MSKPPPVYTALTALFVGSFLLFGGVYDYVIAFQSEANDCFFLFGRPFFEGFLDHPAGLLRYAGRFLGQFYYHPWLGALVVAAAITCFGVFFYRILAKLEGTVPVAQVLVPCVLLLGLQTSPLCVLHDTLGLCVSSGAFLGYLALSARTSRRVYALLITPIVYFLVGAHFWLLVAWIVACEWLKRPPRSGVGFQLSYPVFSASIPVVAWRWIYMIPLRSALAYPFVLGPPVRSGWPDQTSMQFAADCALAAALIGSLLVIPFWQRLFSGTRLAAFWQVKPEKRSRVTVAVAFCAVAVLLHLVRYDGRLATLEACRRLYKTRQWDALLAKARDNPYADRRVQFMTNSALCHKGTLLDEMFHYPQPWGTRGLFLNFSGIPVASPEEDDTAEGMYNSDLLYEMGHANFAMRHAFNCICLQGKTYETLKRMAQCGMLNGNNALAEKYLNLLDESLFYRGFAKRYKAILADPDAEAREFGELRERLPTADGFGHPVRYFATLLEASPDNRMARDYLTAWLLLNKKQDAIDAVCSDVPRLREAGYDRLPAHCQEAMLIKEMLGHAPVEKCGFHYDAQVVARANEFLRGLSSGQAVWRDVNQVQALYGDTYMFYCFFVTTPDEVPQDDRAAGRFGGGARVE